MKIVQLFVYLILIILLAVIGCIGGGILGAIFGLFILPIYFVSWVNEEGTTKTSDTI